MSYADAAASGPKQSPEELEHTEASTDSLVDVDGPHVRSVPEELTEFTETQVRREEREAEQAAAAAREKADAAKQKTVKKANELKEKARAEGKKLADNSDNPVVIGNAALLGIGALALGFGAWHKHSRNELTGKLVGGWAAGLTALAVADFFTSQWLFKNKFPKK